VNLSEPKWAGNTDCPPWFSVECKGSSIQVPHLNYIIFTSNVPFYHWDGSVNWYTGRSLEHLKALERRFHWIVEFTEDGRINKKGSEAIFTQTEAGALEQEWPDYNWDTVSKVPNTPPQVVDLTQD